MRSDALAAIAVRAQTEKIEMTGGTGFQCCNTLTDEICSPYKVIVQHQNISYTIYIDLTYHSSRYRLAVVHPFSLSTQGDVTVVGVTTITKIGERLE